jgi:hypothetical protein
MRNLFTFFLNTPKVILNTFGVILITPKEISFAVPQNLVTFAVNKGSN